MTRLRAEILDAAQSDEPVFLHGESGTGKDLVARAIHAGSDRGSAPLVTLNASGVPDDILDRELYGPPDHGHAPPYPSVPRYLAQAQGGTLLVDDICRMSRPLQARLVHLLQGGEIIDDTGARRRFDARFMAATNTDLDKSLRDGHLRRDLHDRLAVFPIALPPLRSRDRDAGRIAEALFPALLAELGEAPRPLPPAIVARINVLAWPGNVRQLINVLRRMALGPAGDEALALEAIGRRETGRDAGLAGLDGLSFAAIEKKVIRSAIDHHDGSVQKAARQLEVAASTIYRKLKAWEHDERQG